GSRDDHSRRAGGSAQQEGRSGSKDDCQSAEDPPLVLAQRIRCIDRLADTAAGLTAGRASLASGGRTLFLTRHRAGAGDGEFKCLARGCILGDECLDVWVLVDRSKCRTAACGKGHALRHQHAHTLRAQRLLRMKREAPAVRNRVADVELRVLVALIWLDGEVERIVSLCAVWLELESRGQAAGARPLSLGRLDLR